MARAVAKQFKAGDWVRIRKAGIWQIYRLITPKVLDPVTEKQATRAVAFAKRFLTNAFKPSFDQDCCEPDLAKKLTAADKKKLDSYITNNPEKYEAFLARTPEQIDSIYNARIAAPENTTSKSVAKKLKTKRKFTELEIASFLESKGFPDGMPSWTVQFVSTDHECDAGGYLVYSFDTVLEF